MIPNSKIQFTATCPSCILPVPPLIALPRRRVVKCYGREDCDGPLLSAVTCQGVRLPVPELVSAASRVRRPRFVVVDAAQAVNHAPLHLTDPYCDFLVAGCHKWLRAYHPMGLGFCCRPAADTVVAETSAEMTERGQLEDPLLRFTRK